MRPHPGRERTYRTWFPPTLAVAEADRSPYQVLMRKPGFRRLARSTREPLQQNAPVTGSSEKDIV